MSTGLYSPFELCFVHLSSVFFPLTNRPPSFLLLINRLSHSSPYNSFIPSLSTCTIQTFLPNLLNPYKNTVKMYTSIGQIWFTLFTFSLKSSLLCYDFLSSTTLDELLRKSRGTLNLDVVLEVAIDLIYAIQCMEQKGVVHNNITRANVLIGRGLRVIFIWYNMLTCFARRIKNGVVSFNV